MKTKTLYFSHDFNASSDDKIVYLCEKFGGIAYGFYWHVIEKLHAESDNKIFIKPYSLGSIAKFLKIDISLLKEIIDYAINECELFESDGESFWSERVFKNVEKYDEYIEGKKRGGAASAAARAAAKAEKEEEERLLNNSTQSNTCSTGVQHNSTGVQHNSTEANKLNEIKLNESKLNKNILLPFKFSEISSELKSNSQTKEFCIKTYKIKENQFTEFIDFFIGLNSDHSDNEIVCFKEWNKHFKEWMKYNYNKLPQAQQQTTNKKIITPPK